MNIKDHENPLESKFNELNITADNDTDIDRKNCSYCNKPFTEELWCKECDPFRIIEGWTSENPDIDKFIKDTIYDSREHYDNNFLEWVPFDKFTNIKEIGKGGFAKVYSAVWINGKSYYDKKDDGNWEKRNPKPMKVALKRLNESQNNVSLQYLNELKIHWHLCKKEGLRLYGMTKDPETKEFMVIMRFANKGNLRNFLSNNFKILLWRYKIKFVWDISLDIVNLHKSGYFHKDFHSGNILQIGSSSYISDFGLSGPANEKKSNDKIYGVLPYIAPEVLNGEQYTESSDIYSFGVVMAEISSGKPPFYDRKHDLNLALAICNGLRPEFGKGTPKIYKKISYDCMNANPNERPTANGLWNILEFLSKSIDGDQDFQEKENFGYKGKEIKSIFEEADKEIPNISTSYEMNPDAIYTSKAFTFKNLSKPINSSYINNEENDEDSQDSQLVNLEIS